MHRFWLEVLRVFLLRFRDVCRISKECWQRMFMQAGLLKAPQHATPQAAQGTFKNAQAETLREILRALKVFALLTGAASGACSELQAEMRKKVLRPDLAEKLVKAPSVLSIQGPGLFIDCKCRFSSPGVEAVTKHECGHQRKISTSITLAPS